MNKKSFFLFLKKNLVFIIILFIAFFLRVYRLDKLTTFGGDQGIDFLTVRDMVLYHKWTLLGIKTSIAPFFQGPIYLYILYPFFLLFHLQPIAGPISAVFISMISIIVLYIFMEKNFTHESSLFSTALFAVSPQLIMYGNTPLYQHFLPLFIIISLYFFLIYERNIIILFLLGLSVGIGMELHFLNVSLAIAFFIFLIFFTKRQLQKTILYIVGIIAGLSPTIFFEFRHNFFNTHLFLNYLQHQKTSISFTYIFSNWIKGAGMFIGGNSMIIGFILLLGIITILMTKKISEHFSQLRLLTLLTIFITIILSLKSSAFEPHYALPVWILFLCIMPIFIEKIFPRKIGFILMGLLVVFNLIQSGSALHNNHGYTMPAGWTMKKIVQVGKIISLDSKKHNNFNVASILDGNTRTYPVRYTTLIHGGKPDSVENYPKNDYLYLISDKNENNIFKKTTWEVTVFKPFIIGAKWNLNDNVFLYRLDRIK